MSEPIDGWYNAMTNLLGVVRDFASDDVRRMLANGPIDGWIDSWELYETYTDFSDMVGPEQDRRARKLPANIDDAMRIFRDNLESLVCSDDRVENDAALTAGRRWTTLQLQAAELANELSAYLKRVSAEDGRSVFEERRAQTDLRP
jgi:hypothetical protein